jgi:uncharacterized protein (DUF433 family)
MSTVAYAHIEITPEGVPIISGTRTKVIEVALDRIAYHWDADEMHRQHPHLSLAQIYAALTYYYDHQEEMNREIERQLDEVAAFRAKLGDSTVRIKLKQKGLLK